MAVQDVVGLENWLGAAIGVLRQLAAGRLFAKVLKNWLLLGWSRLTWGCGRVYETMRFSPAARLKLLSGNR